MKTTRKLAALAVAGLIALAATACQPPATGTVVKPPASAQHAHGIKDSTVYITWGFGSTYCEYLLTVVDPTNHVVWTSAGGPTVGSTFVTPLTDGTYSAWITSTSHRAGKPCTSSLRMVDSL